MLLGLLFVTVAFPDGVLELRIKSIADKVPSDGLNWLNVKVEPEFVSMFSESEKSNVAAFVTRLVKTIATARAELNKNFIANSSVGRNFVSKLKSKIHL